MKLQRSLLILATATAMQSIDAGAAEDPRFIERGYRVDSATVLGRAGIARVDLDGDGIAELVLDGQSIDTITPSQRVLVVLSGTQGHYRTTGWRLLPDDDGLAQTLAWTPQNEPSIITVGNNGTVRRYLGPSLEQADQFSTTEGVVRAAIGDTDADGRDDLVVLTSDGLRIYRLDDGQLLRSHAVSGQSDLALAQLDADPALEIILGGSAPGLVLDGATLASDWTYIDSFGTRLAAGRLGADGSNQWVGISAWYQFTVFRALPWSPLWTGQVLGQIDSIAVSQIDGHSRDVILIGESAGGAVVIDGGTQQQLYRVNGAGYDVSSIVSGDFDGDDRIEIAFASTSLHYLIPALTIANSADGSSKWQLYPATGALTAVGFGDVDGDGRHELVAASNPLNSQPGTIKIFDALSGEEKWRSPLPESNMGDPFYLSVTSVQSMPRGQGQGLDIVLAGPAGYDSRILVIDGVTKQPRLDIFDYPDGPLQSRWIEDLALVDYDGDQRKDLAVITRATLSNEIGVRVHVFSGIDGSLLWLSPVLGAADAIAHQLLIVGDNTSESDLFLVAVLHDGLRAFHRRTGLLAWTLMAANDGATFISSGVSSAEIAVFSSAGSVRFYDAVSQSLLRDFTVAGGPIRSITALGGDVRKLLVATHDGLLLIDGQTGLIRAASGQMSPFPTSGVQLATHQAGADIWDIASGTQMALYRHRLELSEDIFANGFDP
ncbi:MAG: hypothetical protein NVV68_18470 [Dokdonella sp.]|jgi:hypothetical protein|nr:hypothetical protein [Dokdonella sp.]